MAKKKKITEKPIVNEASKNEEIIIVNEAPVKKSKMYRARIVRKKLVRE